MSHFSFRKIFGALAVFGAGLLSSGCVLAQSDEIQVYDGGLATPGTFNLTWHNNYTPSGNDTPAFPGGITSDNSLNGVTEWAYGVNDWFEAGLYLPLYSHDKNQGFTYNGFKLRTLFAVPHADERKFFYGVGLEFSFNQKRWDENYFTSEIRPIIGWHLGDYDVIFNTILDTAYDGVKNLEFVPSARIAYNMNSKWSFALEDYSDFGPLHKFLPASQQSHQLFGVVDYAGMPIDVEFGIGAGLTKASDNLAIKLILSMDLN